MTVSKLNKSLPVCRGIYLTAKSVGGKDSAYTLNTAENGTWACKFFFKQPVSKKYPYQIQYRERTRSASTGAYTAWSDWKNARQFTLTNACRAANVGSGKPFPAGTTNCNAGSTVYPAYWLGGNRGQSTTTDYLLIEDANGTVASTNVSYQRQYRIRTYNADKKTHGNWFYGEKTLTIKRRASVINETFYRTTAGGLVMTFKASKAMASGAKIVFKSIKDKNGNELLEKELEVTPKGNNYATPTANYQAFSATVKLSELKHAVSYNQKLAIKGYFVNKWGTRTDLPASIRVAGMGSISKPDIRIETDVATGIVKVKLKYPSGGQYAVSNCSCVATYTSNGETRTIKPSSTSKNYSKTTFATFTFKRLPFKFSVTFKVTIQPVAGAFATKTFKKTKVLNVNNFVLTGVTYPSIVASCWGNPSITYDRTGRVTAQLTEGRSKPFAIIGKGVVNDIQLSGSVHTHDTRVSTATRAKWEKVGRNPGIYTLRTPNGHILKVAVQEVQISSTSAQSSTINVSMVEVS